MKQDRSIKPIMDPCGLIPIKWWWMMMIDKRLQWINQSTVSTTVTNLS